MAVIVIDLQNLLSERLTIEKHNGREITMVNYSGLKEKEMIELVQQHQKLALQTPMPFVANFQDTYATTGYVIQAKQFVSTTKSVVEKGALLGIDPIKAMILKGIIFMFAVNYKAFETKEEAVAFLTESKPPQQM